MYDEIMPNDVENWVQQGAQIVDVREPWEFAGGRVPGSINIPLGEFVARQGELRSPLVLVCASGNRSGMAADYLARQNFGRVANLVGGMQLWAARGFEVERAGAPAARSA